MTQPYDVIIGGAGPVGLTLAIALGQQGVRCLIFEKNPKPTTFPKMERCNARTMEIYRRLGLAQKIRNAGFPGATPMDVFIVRNLAEKPILHLPYPSVNKLKEDYAQCRDGKQPLEPYQLISQYTLEPLLKKEAELLECLDVRYSCELTHFQQDDAGVRVFARTADGAEQTFEATYLVGCDGGASTVRKQLGIELEGQGGIRQMRQALFRCDELFDKIVPGPGRHYHVADQHNSGIVVQDDLKHFSLHASVETDEEMPELFKKIVGFPVEFETLYIGKWTQHLLVANKYQDGRVFLAGDSAHLVIPTGGLGMNTGIGDAIDLAWKLAGAVKGWAGEHLLASYEKERRQVGIRNVSGSGFAAKGRNKWRAAYTPEVDAPGEVGQRARDAVAAIADKEQRKTNEQLGTELGYIYRESNIICKESGVDPDQDIFQYQPSTWPGARLPNVWIDQDFALQDIIGNNYAVLTLNHEENSIDQFVSLLAANGIPIQKIALKNEAFLKILEKRIIVLRPDLHVAWRGDSMQNVNIQEIFSTITGRKQA